MLECYVSQAMHGKSFSGNRARVVCDGSIGLTITKMVDLKIELLTFTSCSRKFSGIIPDILPTVVYVTLLLQSIQYAELVNCSFSDNSGTVVVHNTISLFGREELHTKQSFSIIIWVGNLCI